MADQVKMDFELMDQMISTVCKSKTTMDEVDNVISGIISKLEGGALIGEAGTAFSEACKGPLKAAIRNFTEALVEMEKDLKQNVNIMRDSDKTSEGFFN